VPFRAWVAALVLFCRKLLRESQHYDLQSGPSPAEVWLAIYTRSSGPWFLCQFGTGFPPAPSFAC
jgi:hypothetical protein